MPHADLKYSADLEFDVETVMEVIEKVLQDHDDTAGACKCRAYPSDIFRHRHLLVEIAMLPKAHRDTAFIQALRDDLEVAIKAHLRQPLAFSMAIRLNDGNYITNLHEPQAG